MQYLSHVKDDIKINKRKQRNYKGLAVHPWMENSERCEKSIMQYRFYLLIEQVPQERWFVDRMDDAECTSPSERLHYVQSVSQEQLE